MEPEKIKSQLDKIINKSLKELRKLDYELLSATELIKLTDGCIRLNGILDKADDGEDDIAKIFREMQEEKDNKNSKEEEAK